jgi:outer membrane protein TolC
MKHLLALAFCVAMTVAGCTHFQPHPLNATQSAVELTSRRLGGKTWTLSALVAEANRHAPDVALARAQYETARAAVRTAGERPNPTMTLTPQIVTPYTALIEGTYGVDFDWTVETGGKRFRRLEVAKENVRAAAARVVDASWKSRALVRKALLDLYAAQERAKLLGQAVARQGEVLQSIESRITAGAESRSALSQARLLQAQLRLQAADAAKAEALATAALAESLGMGTKGLAGARFSFAAFQRTSPRRSTQRFAALTHRADVLAALADYASAEAALRLEIARQYPDIHLGPGYQLDAGVNKWTLGVGLTLPILNQNGGAIGEAEAKRREAAVKFYAVQAKVLADFDRASAAVEAARSKLAVTEQLVAEQAKQGETEQRLLAAGEGDKLAVISADVERATALTARLDALVELQAAFGALEEATQTPLEP